MSEIEILEIELKDLENAENDIVSAMNNLKSIDGLDDEYTQLDLILQAIDDKKTDIRVEINNLKEESYYKENEEIWKAEKREQEYEYWREVL